MSALEFGKIGLSSSQVFPDGHYQIAGMARKPAVDFAHDDEAARRGFLRRLMEDLRRNRVDFDWTDVNTLPARWTIPFSVSGGG